MEFCRFVFTLYFTVIPITESVNVLSDYILSAGTGGHCGETVSSKESVFVKSHIGAGMFGGLTPYSSNTDCQVTYVAGAGKKVLVLFPFFDLQSPEGDTCNDWLQFSDGSGGSPTTTTVPSVTSGIQGSSTETTTLQSITVSSAASTTLSTTDAPSTTTTISTTVTTTESTSQTTTTGHTTESSSQTTTTGHTTETTLTTTQGTEEVPGRICEKQDFFISSSNQLSIRFVSDGSTQRKGFNLLVTSFHVDTCTSSEFQCDANRCISSSLVCDGIEHCIDGSDESKVKAKCSMVDKTIGTVTSLGSLAMLGIIIIVVAIIFTLVTVIILWKCIKGEASCKHTEDDEEANVPIVNIKADTGNEGGSKQPKQKKSVTIGYGESRVSPTPVDIVSQQKGDKVKGKLHQTSSDVAW